MPAGRKELFREDMIRQAEVLGSFNFTLEQLAHVFDVCPATISRYNKQHPELLEAFKQGKSKLKAKIGSKFVRQIDDGNWDAIKHGLKHVVGWKDDPLIDASQHEHITIIVDQQASKEERFGVYAELPTK
jgi:hypothetical protein